MYIEILIVAGLIFFLCEYSGIVSTKKFIADNQDYLLKLKEKDYDFLLKAKKGDTVDVNVEYNKRIRNSLIGLGIALFVIITNVNYLMLFLSVVFMFLVFKYPYWELRAYRKNHMHEIDVQLPYYLKNLEILIQHYTVPVALGKSIEEAPAVFKDGLQRLVDAINQGDSSIDPYVQFAKDYPVRDSMRMMRLLYRLGLGRQERKQEQLMAFSKTLSNLQQKARETKYKERLEKMESKTMTMLVATGICVMLFMVISILNTFSGV